METTQYGYVSRDEFWRLQNEMKNVSAVQAEHADRIQRLEKRQDDDGRTKSIWGGASPFPSVLGGGTPSADPGYNPAAEAFKNFDQDQTSNMMGSIHLDAEEEPRRGTSRANSVRFDERVLGHFGHASRNSSEFFPMRSSSAFSSHPLNERSGSHKSDGRQSSTHSAARLNSMGSETRAAGGSNAPSAGPPPGLFLLGPLPSIIRCWLNTTFSNETLLYAAICTGSYKSTLSTRLVQHIGRFEELHEQDGERRLKIPVYLPEATISESLSRSTSPAPSLPTITVDFVVSDFPGDGTSIEILLGSDLLRLKSADILFTQDRLSMLDDESNRLTIPLVRPENTQLFKHLLTTSGLAVRSDDTPTTATSTLSTERSIPPPSTNATEPAQNNIYSPMVSSSKRPSIIGEGRRSMSTRDFEALRDVTADSDATSNGMSVEPASRPDPTTLGSWRRDASMNKENTASFSSVASTSGLRGGRSKSMKVLRPSRSSTSSRSVPMLQSPLPPESGTSTSHLPDALTAASSSGGEGDGGASTSATSSAGGLPEGGPRRSFSSDVKSGGTVKARGVNPVGGASAFSWMNPSGQRTTAG